MPASAKSTPSTHAFCGPGSRPCRLMSRVSSSSFGQQAVSPRALEGDVFVGFFAGCGVVSKQARAIGFSAREGELLKGSECDLTKPAVILPVHQMIDKQQVLVAFLAPPCGSFSIINASVCRSESEPWGNGPQRYHKAKASISIDNKCMRAAIQIIKMRGETKASVDLRASFVQ